MNQLQIVRNFLGHGRMQAADSHDPHMVRISTLAVGRPKVEDRRPWCFDLRPENRDATRAGGVDPSQTINEQVMTASRSFDQEIVMLRSSID